MGEEGRRWGLTFARKTVFLGMRPLPLPTRVDEEEGERREGGGAEEREGGTEEEVGGEDEGKGEREGGGDREGGRGMEVRKGGEAEEEWASSLKGEGGMDAIA